MTDSGFEQLFDAGKSLRDYHGLTWKFPRRDLNESARDLLLHLDRVFEILASDSCVFLSTIELDVEAGRFPEVLQQYLWDDVAYSDAMYVAPINGVGTPGRLTFETRRGQIAGALRHDGGWRWGAYLRVSGLQVRREAVAEVIEISPFEADSAQLTALHGASRAAWVASPNLDLLAVWVNPKIVPDDAPEMRRLRALTA
jgi:hypothetical protein